MTIHLSHLQRLEAEAIHIFREVAANFANPVMLYSVGKDSSVLLHLAMKAFFPAKPPFPFLHVDTTWKFREMIAFRDQMAAKLGFDLLVHTNQDGVRAGHQPVRPRLQQLHPHHEDGRAAPGARQIRLRRGLRRRPPRRGEDRAPRSASSRSAMPSTPGTPSTSGRRCGRSTTPAFRPGESIRVFPLSNWTELDIWQYILQENIPIVPLYFAKPRPVVERDGMLIMVDDDRMKLQARTRSSQDRMVRFRTLGCYPLTGAIDSDADQPRRDRRRDADGAHLGAAGPAHRPRRSRLDGKEEARRVFLIVQHIRANEIIGSDGIRDYLALQEKKSLLRFLTCGSVDDGKSTLIGRLLYDTKLIFDDQLATLERDSRKHGTNGERHRLRAAGRRPRGRARARHHHRRRLPLLRHAEAQVHRRRHAGPRAIHPQHGDRRLDGRCRGRAGRCAPGRAGADPAAFDHRLAARHPPRRAGHQQDRSGRLRPGGVRAHRRRLCRLRRQPRLRLDHADPDVGALRRQRHQALRPDGLVCRPDAARASGDDLRRHDPGERAVPLSRCSM